MFSRDYHDPRSHALWGIRVLGTTVCINTGLDMNYFDLTRLKQRGLENGSCSPR